MGGFFPFPQWPYNEELTIGSFAEAKESVKNEFSNFGSVIVGILRF